METKGRKFTVLKALREQRDLRQIQVAQLIDVTQAEVSYLENGWVSQLSPEKAKTLAEFFGIDQDEVLMEYEEYMRRKLLKEVGSRHDDKRNKSA